MSNRRTFILAKVFCQDGVERIAEYHREYWTGSHMEPPEEDVELLWHDSIEKYHSSVEGKKGKV